MILFSAGKPGKKVKKFSSIEEIENKYNIEKFSDFDLEVFKKAERKHQVVYGLINPYNLELYSTKSFIVGTNYEELVNQSYDIAQEI